MQLKGSYQRISQIMQSKIDEYGLTLGFIYYAPYREESRCQPEGIGQ